MSNFDLPHVKREVVREMREACELDGIHLPPLVELWRGDHLVMMVASMDQDVDLALDAMTLAIPSLEPTHVVLVMDATISNHMVNPATGEPWERGDMQEIREQTPDVAAAAALQDALMLTVASRDDCATVAMPYFTDDKKQMHWQEEREMATGWADSGGRVLETVYKLLTMEGPRKQMLATAPGFEVEPVEAAIRLDCVIAKMLLSRGYEVHFLGYGDERDEIINDSFNNVGSVGMMDRGTWN